MERCLVTITHRTVEHNDPEAAGFVEGFWLVVAGARLAAAGLPRGRFETATATRDSSEAVARSVASGYGYDAGQIDVVEALDLMGRTDDEARVERLTADNLALTPQ